MKIDKKIIIDCAIILGAFVIGLIVSACGNLNGVNGNLCDNQQQCVSFSEHPAPAGSSAAASPGNSVLTPTPQGESPSASIPGITQPDPSTAANTCFGSPYGVPSRDTLVSLISNREQDMTCLAIPPQVMDYFIRTMLSYIFSAPPQTWQDRDAYDSWLNQQVTPLVQRCQRGQS